MIAEVLTMAYILIGLVIASAVAYDSRGEPWPPEIQGFMVVCMLWLPAVLLAIIQVVRGQEP